MAYPGPAIIEFRVARTEDVYPWVLGGTSLGEVLPDTPYEARVRGRSASTSGRRPQRQGCERPMSKHTLVATVEEGPVVLNRVLSLFRQRSFAIESLASAAPTSRHHAPDDGRRRRAHGRRAGHQAAVQSHRGPQGQRPDRGPAVERELALIKVSCKAAPQRAEIMQIADIYRARIVDVATSSLMVEVTGPTDKVD